MVKESEQTAFIPGCSVKDFFEIIYADASAARAYHKEVDKDENAQVESWQGNTRTVHFTMPMQLPAVLTKLVGGSAIPVKEVQVAETDGNGALCVTSTPLIGVPGGSKFQAVARLNVTNTATAGVTGCKVDALVTCTASGPWGLTSMIEGVMVEQSATSVQGYLTFCAARCTAALAEKATEGGGEGSESDATVFEQFFDAQEMLSRSTSLASHASERGPIASLTATEIDTLALVQLLDSLEGRWFGWLCADGSRLHCVQTGPACF